VVRPDHLGESALCLAQWERSRRVAPREPNSSLDATVLIEVSVEAEVVVPNVGYERDHKATVATEFVVALSPIVVFPEEPVVLLVKTDGVFNDRGIPVRVIENRVKVMYIPLTITSFREGVGEPPHFVLPDVERCLPVVIWIRVVIRCRHFVERGSIEDGTYLAVFVLVPDIVEDETFPVIEINAEIPLLPANLATVYPPAWPV
jgi:hypothetical protein